MYIVYLSLVPNCVWHNHYAALFSNKRSARLKKCSNKPFENLLYLMNKKRDIALVVMLLILFWCPLFSKARHVINSVQVNKYYVIIIYAHNMGCIYHTSWFIGMLNLKYFTLALNMAANLTILVEWYMYVCTN